MKKILGLIFSITAFGATDPLEFGKYYEGRNPEGVNYIKNSSCFKGVANITGTNTTPSKNTTTPLTSYSDCQSTLDSATDTVEWSANTLDRSLKNGNCEAAIKYKLTLGSGNTIQLQARINSATVASADLVTSDNGTAVVNFPCGDLSNAPSLRIAQTAGSSSQAINVANVYLGAARNIGTVAQAQHIGTLTYASAASCQWSVSSSSWANFAADTDCATPSVTGSIRAAGTKIPGFVFDPAPGRYMVVVSYYGYNPSGSINAGYRLSDGTTGFGETYSYVLAQAAGTISGGITYTTAQTGVTVQLQAYHGSASAMDVYNSFTNNVLRFDVYRFPSSSEIAVRNGQTPAWGSVKWNNTSAAATSTNSSWTTLSNAALATRTNSGSMVAPSSTSDAAGKISNLPIGSYLVFASGALDGSSGSANICRWRISDGTNTVGNTYNRGFGSGSTTQAWVGGVFTYTSQADRTFSIQTLADGGTPTCSVNTDSADKSVELTVVPLSQQSPAPILVGSVTSNSTGAERIERVRFGGSTESPTSQCSSNPCTIYSQSGNWLTSVSYTGTGRYTLNIASGIFSDEPTCTANPIEDTASVDIDANSSTSVAIRTNDGSATPRNEALNVICIGPR